MKEFKEGQLVAYINVLGNELYDGVEIEIGRIKSINKSKKTAFVYYHLGETTACTNFSNIYPIRNDYCITDKFATAGQEE